MKILRFLPLLVTLLFLHSCSSVQVTTDYDKTVDFSRYKTYSYMQESISKTSLSDLDKKRILSAIDEEMAAKGYTKSDNPDLLINLLTDAKEVESVDTYYNGYEARRSWGWVLGSSHETISTSTEGILFIDVLNSKTRELIWQGKGTGYLASGMKEKDERAKAFASKILETFPNK